MSGTPSRRPSGPRCCASAAGAGHGIRRYATSVRPDGDGWDLVEAPFSDVGWYAEHLASFGRAVIAVEPADLREAVITQLKGAMA